MSGRKAAIAVPFLVFLGVYGVAVGHGFISDDFRWILDSRVQHARDLGALFFKSNGFYRPVVALTFALDYAMFGVRPLGYGLTNLLLAAGCAVLVFQVARQFELSREGSLLAAALWLLNPHGVNTAIIWMSGRTSLLLTLASLTAALLILRERPFWALVPAALALFSKEEAVLLPAMLFTWWLIVRRERRPSAKLIAGWWILAVLLIGVYLSFRFQSGAMTPWTAPPYYRFTTTPAVLGRNIFEYADRAMTFPAAVALLAWLILRPTHLRPSTTVLVCGAAWIVGGYGLTVFVPVRSSLYACFPSVGACLIAADVAEHSWRASTATARTRAAIAGVIAALAMAPVYVQRNRATIANARFSSHALARLAARTRDLRAGSTVIVIDDRKRHPNLETSFNTTLDDAFEVESGKRLVFWIEPELQTARRAGVRPPCEACAAAEIDLRRQ